MGKERFNAYWQLNAPVKTRAKELEKEWKELGYIKGLDDRPFFIRSAHKLFNTDCQGSGSIIMDISMILMYQWADRVDDYEGVYYYNGLPAKAVLFMHKLCAFTQ